MTDGTTPESAHPMSQIWADAWHAWEDQGHWAACENLAKSMNTRPTIPSKVTEAMVEAGARAASERGTAADWTHAMGISRDVLQAALAHNAAQPDAGLVEAAYREGVRAGVTTHTNGGPKWTRDWENMRWNDSDAKAALKGAAK